MHPPTGPATPPGPETAIVFAPTPVLMVAVEREADGVPEMHLHAGGQGFWVARMLTVLGVAVTLAGAFGGETGAVLRTLVGAEGVHVRATTTAHPNGAHVHDRRGSHRHPLVTVPPPVLTRHEIDELYTDALAAALSADVAVLSGPDTLDAVPPQAVPADTYRRLAADLRAVGVPVVADLSGEPLTAALRGGVSVLKVSHDDLIRDGRAERDAPGALAAATRALAEEGADTVVVSRAGEPALALIDGDVLAIEAPPLQETDHRGAGDSMTAGITAAVARGASPVDSLRLGAAAGALNITRRGLATGQRDVIESLAGRVRIRPFEWV